MASSPGRSDVRYSRLAEVAHFIALALFGYGLLAYVILPFAWTHYEHQQGLADRWRVVTVYEVSGMGPMLEGRNGGGDHYCRRRAARLHSRPLRYRARRKRRLRIRTGARLLEACNLTVESRSPHARLMANVRETIDHDARRDRRAVAEMAAQAP